MPTPPLIEIVDATLWRGSSCVFQNLSLHIAQGERVAILGPNGSGKTTLLMALHRELYPVANPQTQFRILGQERWNVWALRRRIGFVSHDLQARYKPSTTAIEVVASGFTAGIGTHAASAAELERASCVLRDLGIAELADTAYAELSTGQQRRCILGRSLVHDPDTLILDEPTASLDPAAAADYLIRIRRHLSGNRSLVLVTHHISEIPPEVSRVILLDRGRVVGDGDKTEMLTSECLSRAFGAALSVAEIDGFYAAVPAGCELSKT